MPKRKNAEVTITETPITEAPINNAEPETNKVRVYVPRLNVRKGPTINAKIVKTVAKNDVLEILAISGDNTWGKIKDGWVMLTYTKPVE